MQFLFPYHKVEKNSTIVLYGIGNVGKQFYRQLVQTKYCSVVGWSDRVVERYAETQGKFIPADKIMEISFDYVVVAVATFDVAQEIKAKLIRMGVDRSKIVWEESYEINSIEWPDNVDCFLQNGDFLLKIMDMFCCRKQQFGEGKFYQSYPMLGLRGQRPTQERIESYGLRKILDKHMDVLDIGCNCGFFDLQISELIHTITGLEINLDLVQIAEFTKKYLGKSNCIFLHDDFCSWYTEKKYDMVFAFAILCWIDIKPPELAERIIGLIKREGFFLMESHNVHSKERLNNFDMCIECLKDRGMYEVRRGTICDDGVISRKFVLLRNTGE